MKVLEEYLNYIEKNKKLSKNTVASYNRDLKKYIEYLNTSVSARCGIKCGETSVDEGLKEAEDYANGLLDEYWANK